MNESIEVREKKVKEREAQLNQQGLEEAAKKLLKEKGLPEELLSFALQENLEETKQAVNVIKKVIANEIEKALTEELGKKAPKIQEHKGNMDANLSSSLSQRIHGMLTSYDSYSPSRT